MSRTHSSQAVARRGGGRDVAPFVIDIALVALFVFFGRTSHNEPAAATGYLRTAWPFLVGALVGWAAIVLVRRRGRQLPGDSLVAGGVVLGATVVGGMLLRVLFTDRGAPISFVVVASSVLAAFLLGWRGIARFRGGSES